MNKIPVGKTIAYAYSFTFGHLGTIIGLVWLPLVIMAVLHFLQMAGSGMGATDQSPLAMGSQAIGSLAIQALSLLLYAIIYVGVTRQALGLRQGAATFYFALGMPEYRMFGAYLLLFVIGMAFLFTYFGVLTISATAGGSSPLTIIATSAVAVVGASALVYVLVRLSFLLAPVTVAEEQINLGRGWMLTQGNFWRIFGVLLAIGVPLFVIYIIGTAAIMGKDAAANIPPNVANSVTLALQYEMHVIDRHLPGLLGLQLVLAPFSLGLSLGASAFAYRSVVQDSAVVRTV
jgi:hypothetical protein